VHGQESTRRCMTWCKCVSTNDRDVSKQTIHTEELLGSGTSALNDLNDTWPERLDSGNMVREDTHVAGRRGQVDLRDFRSRHRLRVGK
jgi:hypothetical protein